MRAGTKDTKPCLGDTMDDLHGKKARWEASGNTEEEEAMINPPWVLQERKFWLCCTKGQSVLGVRMPRRPECSGSWKPDCSWIRRLRTGAWKPVRGELWETAMALGLSARKSLQWAP